MIQQLNLAIKGPSSFSLSALLTATPALHATGFLYDREMDAVHFFVFVVCVCMKERERLFVNTFIKLGLFKKEKKRRNDAG